MGASAFLFNILDTKMVNPLGLNTEGGLFPEAVYARWPGKTQDHNTRRPLHIDHTHCI
jgi:hypothetical protein